MQEFPYLISRNKNSINLIDINNRHMQPLIEIRNAELFCEKITLTRVDGHLKLMYVTWHNERTFVKEITLPEEFCDTLKSAADLWDQNVSLSFISSTSSTARIFGLNIKNWY